MTVALIAALTALNVVFLLGILFNLPGTWLMVLAAALLEWWTPETALFGPLVLYVALGLAAIGELLEFVLGAAGARKSGGSRRGAVLAIVGGIVGAVLGTPLPVPVLGTLIGACAGAFAGSVLGDLWAGHPLRRSLGAGGGAALGRFWGTVAKLAVGIGILGLLVAAPFA
jgi:uncharacterized protein YqgC (DUF456 family)